MTGHIAIVQIAHPGPSGAEGEGYWETGRGARLSSMYGRLLGMQPIYIGYHKLVHQDGSIPELGFEYAPHDPPPRWPDPDHPQQVHFDVEVGDLAEASRIVLSEGASQLVDNDAHRVFADPVGHPFCLYPRRARTSADGTAPGRIARIVIDCFSPRALAAFYEQFLELRTRLVDTAERVEIAGDGSVILAFQHSPCQPPRWPDPSYPAQLHLDLAFEDAFAAERAEQLGAIRHPQPERPDHLVYADPGGHPFCLGLGGWGTYGPAQVAEYEGWVAASGTGE